MARILVADDSLTIQKVVSITLSSLPYQLVQAKSEGELNTLLKTDKFDLILLDFGLVDKKSGYDLARDVRKAGYQGPILTLVGTFDSIDEGKLKDARIDDYITKPFESEKFINKCQNLLSGSSTEKSSSSILDIESIDDLNAQTDIDIKEATKQFGENDDTNWVMNTSHETSGVRELDMSQLDDESDSDLTDSSLSTDKFGSQKNKLHEDLSGWGVGVPDVIGKPQETAHVPPKLPERRPEFQTLDPGEDYEIEKASPTAISQSKTDVFHIGDFLTTGAETPVATGTIKIATHPPKKDESDESKLPREEDLEYPSFSFEPMEKPKSKLIPLEELAPSTNDDADVTDPAFELPQALNEKLLEQLQTDEDPDKFWATDSSSSTKKENVKPQVFSSEKAGIKFDENWEFRTNHIDSQPPVTQAVSPTKSTPSIDEDAIVQKIMAKLTPLLEAKLKDYCKTSVERIAWEVIPDLAENLIREEIKKIESQTEA